MLKKKTTMKHFGWQAEEAKRSRVFGRPFSKSLCHVPVWRSIEACDKAGSHGRPYDALYVPQGRCILYHSPGKGIDVH